MHGDGVDTGASRRSIPGQFAAFLAIGEPKSGEVIAIADRSDEITGPIAACHCIARSALDLANMLSRSDVPDRPGAPPIEAGNVAAVRQENEGEAGEFMADLTDQLTIRRRV